MFSGLSLSVSRGLVGVAGRNGSGKTTLLKILASLLRPDAGTVSVTDAGRELARDARRRAIGWSGLDLALYDDLTALENLRFFRRAAGMRCERRQLLRRLELVGLEREAGRAVGGYSTGMKQRLRLAFALLFDPPLLLLDEPFAGMDAEGRARVGEVLKEKRSEGAVVLASNDPRDLEDADRVLDLGSGVVPRADR